MGPTPAATAGSLVTVDDLILSAATTDARPTAIFMTLSTADNALSRTLVAVTTNMCGRTELHDHIREGDVMRMRQVPEITIAPGKQVVMRPMGLHIMCFDPSLPQNPGDKLTVTLAFADGATQDATGQILSFQDALRHPYGQLTH